VVSPEGALKLASETAQRIGPKLETMPVWCLQHEVAEVLVSSGGCEGWRIISSWCHVALMSVVATLRSCRTPSCSWSEPQSGTCADFTPFLRYQLFLFFLQFLSSWFADIPLH
jgi:hypothetical protein